MAVIRNSWVEKVKKKKVHETAPSYEAYSIEDDFATQTKQPSKRHTPSLKATMSRTLRGVRKQMQCRHCNYPDSRVVETTKDERTNQIYRRRECVKCGVRFTTQEHLRQNYERSPYKTNPPRQVLEK